MKYLTFIILMILIIPSCAVNSYSGKGTATIVKANGKVKHRNMKKAKCIRKRMRVEKRNHYARLRRHNL